MLYCWSCLYISLYVDRFSNSYTMMFTFTWRYPQALANELSYVQVDKHGITFLYHLHQCIPFTS